MTTATQNKLHQIRQLVRRSQARLKKLEGERAELERNLNEVDKTLKFFANNDSAALVRAVEKEDLQLVREQLKKGADPDARAKDGEPVLLLASLLKNLPIVRELLNAGAQVDRTNATGDTSLIVAVNDDNLAVVKELVKHKANVNARNRDGDTPLTNAACWGSRAVVKLLLAHSADPNLPDGLNVAAAEIARQQGHLQIARLLERAAR